MVLFHFIESPAFSEQIGGLMTDAEYAEFQRALAMHPAAGEVVPGLGGLRKIRWAAKGKGNAAELASSISCWPRRA
jgi:hypothetical protein